MLLDRARRHDHPRRMHMHELAVAGERHVQPLVDPERGEPLQHRDVLERPNVGRELGEAVRGRPRGDHVADAALVAHEHRAPGAGVPRGIEPGDAGADHERAHVLVADDLTRRGRRGRQGAEPGRSSDHPLGDGPREPWTDERLVIEPDGHHAVQRVGHVQQVALRVRESTRTLDAHALGARSGARVHCRALVDRHQAVGAIAGAAVQAAPTVILQRPRERANARPVQGRRDGVALLERDGSPFELDRAHVRTPRSRSCAYLGSRWSMYGTPSRGTTARAATPRGFSGR